MGEEEESADGNKNINKRDNKEGESENRDEGEDKDGSGRDEKIGKVLRKI